MIQQFFYIYDIVPVRSRDRKFEGQDIIQESPYNHRKYDLRSTRLPVRPSARIVHDTLHPDRSISNISIM